MNAEIIIGGDVCPIGRNRQALQQSDARAIFRDLLDDISNADLAVANLECPLIERWTPIAKTGPAIGVSPECINGFKAAGWDLLNLANNHSYDHGREGLESTILAITGAGLAFVGTYAHCSLPLGDPPRLSLVD